MTNYHRGLRKATTSFALMALEDIYNTFWKWTGPIHALSRCGKGSRGLRDSREGNDAAINKTLLKERKERKKSKYRSQDDTPMLTCPCL
jgi:hypothetical protein